MAFCSICGSPVSASGSPLVTPGNVRAAGAFRSPNLASALMYPLALIAVIVFLVIEPYRNDGFVRFHAFRLIFCVLWSSPSRSPGTILRGWGFYRPGSSGQFSGLCAL
jgi:hypothetical protein